MGKDGGSGRGDGGGENGEGGRKGFCELSDAEFDSGSGDGIRSKIDAFDSDDSDMTEGTGDGCKLASTLANARLEVCGSKDEITAACDGNVASVASAADDGAAPMASIFAFTIHICRCAEHWAYRKDWAVPFD